MIEDRGVVNQAGTNLIMKEFNKLRKNKHYISNSAFKLQIILMILDKIGGKMKLS
jgi:hypothetical protein